MATGSPSCIQNQRTAVLWIQYMHTVDILRTFIRAERTGNWKLHLQAVHDMLPYFAAAGHNPYAKSAYLYLQLMYDLQKEHPHVTPVSRMVCTLYVGVIATGLGYPLIWKSNRSSCVVSRRAVD